MLEISQVIQAAAENPMIKAALAMADTPNSPDNFVIFVPSQHGYDDVKTMATIQDVYRTAEGLGLKKVGNLRAGLNHVLEGKVPNDISIVVIATGTLLIDSGAETVPTHIAVQRDIGIRSIHWDEQPNIFVGASLGFLFQGG